MKTLHYVGITMMLASCAFAAQSELVGEWKTKDGKEMIEFTPDGHVRSLAQGIGVEGKYECKADIVILKFNGDGAPPKVERKYAVLGEDLKLEEVDNHHVTEFRRVDKKKG